MNEQHFLNLVSASFHNLHEDSSDEEDCIVELGQIVNFAEEIVPTYPNKQFKEHFRLDVETFNMLCKGLHDMDTRILHSGRFEMPIEKQVLIALWFFGNRETFRTIINRFGCAINTISKKLLALNIEKGLAKWPTYDEKAATKLHYLEKHRFCGIIGAINGTEIRLIAQHDHPNCYINRKRFHAVNLQAICDHRMKFISYYAGEVGSVHDARVLQCSKLESSIQSGECGMTESEHILGDSAYPLKTWLLTPYKNNGHLTDAETIYNTVHSKCRVVIERACGMLKGRFRRLKYIKTKKTELIPLYIGACCILHNFYICVLLFPLSMLYQRSTYICRRFHFLAMVCSVAT